MKNSVGAKGLTSNKVFCSACLVEQEILFKSEDEISRSKAHREKLICTACGKPLVPDKAEKTLKNKK